MSSVIEEVEEKYNKKIEALQQELERLRAKKASVISMLHEDLGAQEIASSEQFIDQRRVSSRKAKAQVKGGPTTRTRGIQALDRMPLTGFGTAEWLRAINDDGNPTPITNNRALKIFKELVDEGVVEILEPRSGKRGGVYKKVNKDSKPSPALLELF